MSDAPTPHDEAARSAAPLDPEVARMETAHERGDFRDARARAQRLAGSDDAALRAQGQAMIERHRVDPVIVAVIVATGALIVALAGMYLGHPQHRPSAQERSGVGDAPRGERR